MRFALICLITLALCSPDVYAGGILTDPAQAGQLSKSSGLPMLVFAGRSTCPNCQRVAKQLTTDPQAAQLASKFVVLKVDVDGNTWGPVSQKVGPSGGTTLPFLYVVRGDGQVTGRSSGIPDSLPTFLATGLRTAGRQLSAAEVRKLTTATKALDAAVENNDTAARVRLAVQNAGSGSFADLAQRFDNELAALNAEATSALAENQKTMTEADSKFEPVLELVTLSSTYGALPEVGKQITVAVRDARTTIDDGVNIVKAAEAIDSARSHQAKGNTKAAAAQYQQAIETGVAPAVTIAKKSLDELDVEAATVVTTPVKPDVTEKPAAAMDLRKAQSRLRLGKLMKSRNPSKAKSYFEEAIELAPGTDVAEEAKSLLQGL